MNLLLLLPVLVFIPLLFPSSTAIFRAGEGFDGDISHTIVVDSSGKGDFQTVQAAIDSVPSHNDKWIKIQINAGTYVERVQIPAEKPYIILQGEDRETTIISYNGHERTDLSATFSSYPDNIVAIAITFKNSFNLAKESGLYDREKKSFITQAVAARIYGDKSAFYWCGFEGFQDTLWDASGRHYYKNCYIEGAIDFIFGAAQSIFEDCQIYANVGSLPEITLGYMTAQGRSTPDDSSGFVFINGNVTGSGQVYLGRAYGPYSRVVFYKTYLSSIVYPQGWDGWTYQGKESNFMYAEVHCEGPGSSTTGRVPWEKSLNDDQIRQFSVSSFIDQDKWIEKIPAFKS